MARTQIKKSVRFEVFKRDSFTCQYCGRKAPDVVLEVDHITPVAAGGENDILNLVTSCRECNAGKSDRKLSESAAVEKRIGQLKDLEERRQQLQMLHDWHMSLVNLDDQAIDMAQTLWFEAIRDSGSTWTQKARDEVRKLIKRSGFEAVCGGIREAAECAMRSSRIDEDKDGVTNEWFWKIGGVISYQRLKAEDPDAARLLYIRGIVRNRCFLYSGSEWKALALLKEAHSVGVPVDWMESTSKAVSNWSDWKFLMEDAIQKYEQPEGQEDHDGTRS
jgi:hypothetical protein